MTEATDTEHRVKPLELFFDLVFVLAFTQVTTKLSHDLTWEGLCRSMLVLAVLWWAWAGFAWLTNAFDPETRLMRVPIFVAIAALLVVSLAVPEAFGEYALIFAVAYFVVRVIHAIAYLANSKGDAPQLTAVLRMMPAFVLPPLLLLASVPFDGTAQAAIWVLAIVVDYGGSLLLDYEGWHVDAEYFAERFGLIVIIALGESIVSIGVGADGVHLGAETIVAAVLAVSLASVFWWEYFDSFYFYTLHELERKTGIAEMRLARDAYGILHLLLIAGIIFTALAIKKTIGHPEEHFKDIPAVALGLGVAMYLGGQVLIHARTGHGLAGYRAFAALAALAMIPLYKQIPAIWSLTIVIALLVATLAGETWRYRSERSEIRAQHAD